MNHLKWKRLALAFGALGGAAALVSLASFAILTSGADSTSMTLTAGTVTLQKTDSTECFFSHLAPGDSQTCTYNVTYSGSLPAWVGLDASSVSAATGTPATDVGGLATYFTANDSALLAPNDFARSTAPGVLDNAADGVSQTVNADGSVTLTAGSATSNYADSGFVIYYGSLGDLTTLTMSGTGTYAMNLWFGNNGQSDIFSWDSSGNLTGLGGDLYGLGPSSDANGNLVMDGASSFFMQGTKPAGCTAGSYTLAQLQSGQCSAINPSTPVAIWVGVSYSGTSAPYAGATVQSIAFGPPPSVPPGSTTMQGGEALLDHSADGLQVSITDSHSDVLALGGWSCTPPAAYCTSAAPNQVLGGTPQNNGWSDQITVTASWPQDLNANQNPYEGGFAAIKLTAHAVGSDGNTNGTNSGPAAW